MPSLWKPLFGLMLLLLSLFGNSASGKSHKLVEVFCTNLPVLKNSTDDESWAILESALRSTNPDISLSEEPSAQNCLSQFSDDLDEGEFILRGMDLLRMEVPEVASSGDSSSEENLTVDGVHIATVSAPPQVSAESDELMLRDNRRKAYERLWSEWSARMRRKVSSSQADSMPPSSAEGH